MQLEHWEMKEFAPGEGTAQGGDGWIPVSAPGDTYLALHAAGCIPHPFADDNEQACAWLAFEGLDTVAAIWLNGVRIGASDNMFRAISLDISKLLRGDTTRTTISTWRKAKSAPSSSATRKSN